MATDLNNPSQTYLCLLLEKKVENVYICRVSLASISLGALQNKSANTEW